MSEISQPPATLKPIRGGVEAARKWNRTIHGSGPRFDWVNQAIDALVAGRKPPPFPGRYMPGVPEARLETLTRILFGDRSPHEPKEPTDG